MNIWIIDHYAVPPKYYPLARQTIFAKKLMEKGHSVTIFSASTVHNSTINLISENELYREDTVDGVKYVYIKCRGYEGNGISRILNMEEFARKLPKVCSEYEKPDAVLACSLTLQACKKGIKLAQKYGAKGVAQIMDLWPETLIAYGVATAKNPFVWYLRAIEKRIYKKADKLIFTMEGAYDYIKERKWQVIVPESKVSFINNGIDLEAFDYNKEKYKIEDSDLTNNGIIKIVYLGSIRKVNNVGILLDIAKSVRNERIKFLIWGDGDERESLEKRVKDEKISNVVFKGRVDKKFAPYITSNADINIVHNFNSPIFRFGISMNKIFDYFAAGRPIFCDFSCPYNPVIKEKAGIDSDSDIESTAIKLEEFACKRNEEYAHNARKAAEEKYNFNKHVEKLIEILS